MSPIFLVQLTLRATFVSGLRLNIATREKRSMALFLSATASYKARRAAGAHLLEIGSAWCLRGGVS